MKVVIVSKNEAGQRFDKLLGKILNQAPKSFLYKMLRKKNITLNGKKADGSEKVNLGDEIKFFLADETYDKFAGGISETVEKTTTIVSEIGKSIGIVYEDENILVLNKPVGILSQKAESSDVSMVEHVISYLISSKALDKAELATFKPGVCNRLDRNTSGLIVAGKTLEGVQVMSELFKDRSLHKYYRCIVKGRVERRQNIKGYLLKDESCNKVTILSSKAEGAEYIETEYEPILVTDQYTLLEVKLITGKPHQIRAHLKSMGHPIIGDGKYGSRTVNDYFRQTYGLKHQLLHAYRLEFPVMKDSMSELSNQKLIAPLTKQFQNIQTGLFGKVE